MAGHTMSLIHLVSLWLPRQLPPVAWGLFNRKSKIVNQQFLLPPLFLHTQGFNLLKRKFLPVVHAGASPGSFLPVARTGQIARPERPCAALIGPDRVNRAAAFALGAGLQKDTITGLFVFNDTRTIKPATGKLFTHFILGHRQMSGQHPDLFGGNPDIALFRSGTAIPAPGTLKPQSARIPFIFHCTNHNIFSKSSYKTLDFRKTGISAYCPLIHSLVKAGWLLYRLEDFFQQPFVPGYPQGAASISDLGV
jgi:hypothetical protein